jgi:hypothetical protein
MSQLNQTLKSTSRTLKMFNITIIKPEPIKKTEQPPEAKRIKKI